MWGERENKDGSTGDATRFLVMIKYKFNQPAACSDSPAIFEMV